MVYHYREILPLVINHVDRTMTARRRPYLCSFSRWRGSESQFSKGPSRALPLLARPPFLHFRGRAGCCRLCISTAVLFIFFHFHSTRNASLFLINPKLLGGPASGSLNITALSCIQPSEPSLDLLTPASLARKMRVLSQKRDACGILDLSAVT